MRARDHSEITNLLNLLQDNIYLSFMLGLVDLNDIAILSNRPNNCCQQDIKYFDQPIFSLGLFS